MHIIIFSLEYFSIVYEFGVVNVDALVYEKLIKLKMVCLSIKLE